MKSLQNKVFVLVIYSLLSLKLFGMEEEENPNKKSSLTFSEYEKDKELQKSPFRIKIPRNPRRSDSNDNLISTNPSSKAKKTSSLNKSYLPLKTTNVFIEVNQQLSKSHYLGPLPEGAKHIIDSFHATIIEKEIHPMLVKIVGRKDVGKTTLARTIANMLCSNQNRYYEIDITNTQHELDIKSVITGFYEQINHVKSTAIIAFIKGLPLKGVDFKKLREFLTKHQKPAPLLLLHEAKKFRKSDYDYHDKVIRVKPPTQAHFKEFLDYIFREKGFDSEELTDGTLALLKGSYIPRIQRIAETTMRKALLNKDKVITNTLIQESIQ